MKNRFTNETDLLQGINEKNTYALDQFLVPLHAKATYIAYTVVKDNHFAIQAVNDAHLAFIKRPIIFDSLEYARNYFYASAYNKALNIINNAHHKNRKNTSHEFPEIRDNTDLITDYATKEIHKKTFALVDTLPKKQQIIFKRVIDGYKTKEIANEVGEDKQYVLNTKNRIFKNLAAKLQKLLMLL